MQASKGNWRPNLIRLVGLEEVCGRSIHCCKVFISAGEGVRNGTHGEEREREGTSENREDPGIGRAAETLTAYLRIFGHQTKVFLNQNWDGDAV